MGSPFPMFTTARWLTCTSRTVTFFFPLSTIVFELTTRRSRSNADETTQGTSHTIPRGVAEERAPKSIFDQPTRSRQSDAQTHRARRVRNPCAGQRSVGATSIEVTGVLRKARIAAFVVSLLYSLRFVVRPPLVTAPRNLRPPTPARLSIDSAVNASV